eukprot:CAMPEP_0117018088 /NCGR_PEP_ID=MMETSP0472-20121206/14018_1 /TAXON_ID=693140 ORGANISM="Tiarina fusus, Strain LIS" /NCGR_SAMPLE_ID=MMETSP0472 /ASSEMBLY_ACC=CAM_ASM_000603 /LENGTH=134 /DNA_ID=CAMNT_0004722607 /DNA_START=13 /DNA_END=414 /DNA_ORIENTATION=+
MTTNGEQEVELSDVNLDKEDVSEEEDISEDEEYEMPKRTLKDVLLGNQLPPKLLCVAIFSFIASFECFVVIAGFLIDKNYSILFSLPFLLVPTFWGWLFYFSRASLRPTASLQRVLQSVMLGYYADTIVYLGQW